MSAIQQFMRFLLTGGIAALVNWSSRVLFSQWWDYGVAVAAAYLCGMLTAYLLFRAFVFGAGETPLGQSVGYYVLINGVGLALTWGVSLGLGLHLFPRIGMAFYPLEVAHAIGIAAPLVTSYLGHKFFTFR